MNGIAVSSVSRGGGLTNRADPPCGNNGLAWFTGQLTLRANPTLYFSIFALEFPCFKETATTDISDYNHNFLGIFTKHL